MRRLFMAIALILAGLAPPDAAFARERKCLEYEPAVVRLTGVIRRHAALEPPMYDEGSQDKLVHYRSLHLDRPICIFGQTGFNSANPENMENIRQLQIVDSEPGYSKHARLVGHRVAITGTMWVGFNPRHHTSVLIDAQKIEKLP